MGHTTLHDTCRQAPHVRPICAQILTASGPGIYWQTAWISFTERLRAARLHKVDPAGSGPSWVVQAWRRAQSSTCRPHTTC